MKRKSSQIAKFLILLLSIVLIVASMSVNVFASNQSVSSSGGGASGGGASGVTIIDSGICGNEGDNLVWKLNSNYTLTISGEGAMEEFSSPEEGVIPWYNYKKSIKRVVIKDGVTELGNYAFSGFSNLTSVSMPDSLTTLAWNGFSGCAKLASVTIPDSVTIIPAGAFANCVSLTSITIPDGVTHIHNLAFSGCSNLKSVKIGSTVTQIDYGAFSDCNDLTSITIPDSVEIIEGSVFSYCNNLTSIKLGEGINSIGYGAFENCGIKTVYYNGTKAQRNSIVIDSNNESLEDALWHYNADKGTHTLKTTTTKATTSANGKKVTKCAACGTVKSTKTIYKISSVKLSSTSYTYNGSKKTPTVTVKDSKGNKLTNGEDYKITYSSSKRTSIGRYSVKVTFKGDYSGSKTLYFTIGPKNTSSVSAKLYGHDDVKVSWKKVTGASGYRVYYKKSTSDTWKYKTTTGTSIKLANLSDGAKYNIKVSAYKNVKDNKCFNAGKTVNISTLKKITNVKVVKSGSSVKVSWGNISGETGYQISKSTSKTGTNIVSTYKTTSGKSKTLSATLNKAYYYKVRAYKVVDGKKIYGPWSDPIKFTRKNHTHSYNSNYVCSCGAIDKAHSYEYVAEWVYDNGADKGTYREVRYTTNNDVTYSLYVYEGSGDLWVDKWQYTDDGYYTRTALCLENDYYSCTFEDMEIWGYINPKTFTSNTYVSYSGYDGYESLRSEMRDLASADLDLLVYWLEMCLDICDIDITIKDLGFKAY